MYKAAKVVCIISYQILLALSCGGIIVALYCDELIIALLCLAAKSCLTAMWKAVEYAFMEVDNERY